MKQFGDKNIFAIEYKILEYNYGKFELWIYGKPVCCFLKNETVNIYEGNLLYIVEWFKLNISNILNECEYPLPIIATSSLDFLNKSGDFDSDDMSEFDKWYELRQDWYFRHSWYCSRDGSYLADIIFRKSDDKIEIEWDNTNLYENVYFINSKGLYFIDIYLFKNVIDDFIRDFYCSIGNH